MKKYINLFIVGVLVFSSFGLFSIVQAIENPNTSASISVQNLGQEIKKIRDGIGLKAEIKTETRAEVNAKIEKMKEGVKTLREEAKNKMEALKETLKNEKDEVKVRAMEVRIVGREKALERFDNAIEKMGDLKDRINSQITKLKAKGVDVANAESLMVTAETKLAEAKIKIVEINTLLAGSTNQLSTENKTRLRTLAGEIQTLIKETHQALNDVVKSLKINLRIRIEAEIKAKAASADANTDTTDTVEVTQ